MFWDGIRKELSKYGKVKENRDYYLILPYHNDIAGLFVNVDYCHIISIISHKESHGGKDGLFEAILVVNGHCNKVKRYLTETDTIQYIQELVQIIDKNNFKKNFHEQTLNYDIIYPMDLLTSWVNSKGHTEYKIFLEENNLTDEEVRRCIEMDNYTFILNALIKSAKKCSLYFCSQCYIFTSSTGYIHHANKCIKCALENKF